MALGKPLIAAVSQTELRRDKRQAAALQQFEVMDFTRVHDCRNDLSAFKRHQQLRLQGMALLLATVVTFLFFGGRSIAISPTSTISTVHSQPG